MVGLTLALALAQGGLPVAVTDPLPPSTVLDEKFDGRVSALSYSAIRMFRALGVWPHLEADAQPILDILVDRRRAGCDAKRVLAAFRSSGNRRADGRYRRESPHPPRTVCGDRRFSNPAYLAGRCHVRSCKRRMPWRPSFRTASICALRCVVAADGRFSQLREQMGIRTISWSYPQTGIVATVQHSKPHNGVAYEHFLPSGPFAILPMTPASSGEAVGQRSSNRSSLVWTERDTLAPALMQLPPAEFQAEVARRFGHHLGDVEIAGARWSYPLQFHLARGYIATRFALAGDSAHGIHPIAGQGLNLGLKDAAALAECVLDAVRLGLDAGNSEALRHYERWRRFDSFALAAATDGLNRLFSNDIAPLRAIRDLGLGIVDAIGPLRRAFMRNAGGDFGKLPRLLRGEAA